MAQKLEKDEEKMEVDEKNYGEIKTEMRSTMGNERFTSSMLIWTQNDITNEIDYNDAFNNFAMAKARRKPLLHKMPFASLGHGESIGGR
ncbi:hypothetical protein TNCV_2820751 [Trichonephila clavipes]|nr:hypothetical protein TNCV_2820751 [Trichonephila clavipes]